MPRQARIDAPGALHHVIVRGIERRKIFKDNIDRFDFLKRLGKVLSETHTRCFAWALISNHFHLLLRSGDPSLSTVMRRVLTGYAMGFNRRHRRSVFCYWAARELGVTMTRLAGLLKISQPAVSICVSRGEQIVLQEGYDMLDE